MARRIFTTEQIIGKLREAEVLLSQRQPLGSVCRALEISEQTYYRWRKEYGGLRTDQAHRLKELERENVRLKRLVADLPLDKAMLQEAALGKTVSPAARRKSVTHVRAVFGVSERRACRVIRISRSSQRYRLRSGEVDAPLAKQIVALATRYGRYGYRRITALLRREGWRVNHKRVERIWRQEGLKVPPRQPKRGRLWLNDGSCVRLRPAYPQHVWSYDFMRECTHNGRPFRILNVIDEYTRECLATRIARQTNGWRCPGVLNRIVLSARCTYALALGQWTGVHCEKGSGSG